MIRIAGSVWKAIGPRITGSRRRTRETTPCTSVFCGLQQPEPGAPHGRYLQSDPITLASGGGVVRNCTWGDTGNVTLDERAGTATTLVYNAIDRLARIDAGAVTVGAYVHNASGQRAIREVAIAGLAANAQRFPGQSSDPETGYYDNWYRTYHPTLGRRCTARPLTPPAST